MFCPKCGAPADDNQNVCSNCGYALNPETRYSEPPRQEAPAVNNDTGAAGFGVLGFFIPIVGLILFLVWRTTFPKRAKGAGIGAIIGVVFYVIIIIIYIALIASVIGAATGAAFALSPMLI